MAEVGVTLGGFHHTLVEGDLELEVVLLGFVHLHSTKTHLLPHIPVKRNTSGLHLFIAGFVRGTSRVRVGAVWSVCVTLVL